MVLKITISSADLIGKVEILYSHLRYVFSNQYNIIGTSPCSVQCTLRL